MSKVSILDQQSLRAKPTIKIVGEQLPGGLPGALARAPLAQLSNHDDNLSAIGRFTGDKTFTQPIVWPSTST